MNRLFYTIHYDIDNDLYYAEMFDYEGKDIFTHVDIEYPDAASCQRHVRQIAANHNMLSSHVVMTTRR